MSKKKKPAAKNKILRGPTLKELKTAFFSKGDGKNFIRGTVTFTVKTGGDFEIVMPIAPKPPLKFQVVLDELGWVGDSGDLWRFKGWLECGFVSLPIHGRFTTKPKKKKPVGWFKIKK